VKLKIEIVRLIPKKYFFVNTLSRLPFSVNSFGLFRNPMIKPANKEATAFGRKAYSSVLVRLLRWEPMNGPNMPPIHKIELP
jgi:hypothetical protein